MQRRRIFHILFVAPVVVVMLLVGANGYVLQGAHILDMYINHIGKAGGFFVSQKLVVYDAENTDESIEFYQNLKYKYPDSYRSEILATDREWIYVRSGGESVAVINGRIFSSDNTIFDRYTDLLFGRSRIALEQTISDLGINVAVSSLGRFNDKVFYVVGAGYPDESVPQIWFDRESFLPVRWLAPAPGFSKMPETAEILFSEWQPINGRWYPMHIVFNLNGFKIRDIVVEDVNPNTVLPDEQFNIHRIRSAYPVDSGGTLPDAAGSEGPEALKKIIDNFKRIYR
jgi:hypothetical protein